MKKLLLTTVCVSLLTLTACDKKSADTQTAKSSEASSTTNQPVVAVLSTDNAADIKSDMSSIQNASAEKAKEAVTFQTEIMEAVQKNDKQGLTTVLEKMKVYVNDYNKSLDNLALKSTEAVSLRDQIKESNSLGLEMADLSLTPNADPNKIMELQKKAADLQQKLLTTTQALQNKANTAP